MKKLLLLPLLVLLVPALGWAAQAIVQSKVCNTGGSTATSLNCTFDSTPAAGNLIHATVVYYNYNGTMTQAATDNKSNSYVQTIDSGDGGAAFHLDAAHNAAYNISSSATFTVTTTLTNSGAGTYINLTIVEISESATASAADQTGSNHVVSSTTTGTVSTAGATSQNNEISIATFAWASATTGETAGTGYTLIQDTPGVANLFAWADEYKVLGATGTETATITFSITIGEYMAVITTYKAAAAAGGARRRIIN